MVRFFRKLVVAFFVLILSALIFAATSGNERYARWLLASVSSVRRTQVVIERTVAWIDTTIQTIYDQLTAASDQSSAPSVRGSLLPQNRAPARSPGSAGISLTYPNSPPPTRLRLIGPFLAFSRSAPFPGAAIFYLERIPPKLSRP